jgi:hypothetical protein
MNTHDALLDDPTQSCKRRRVPLLHSVGQITTVVQYLYRTRADTRFIQVVARDYEAINCDTYVIYLLFSRFQAT